MREVSLRPRSPRLYSNQLTMSWIKRVMAIAMIAALDGCAPLHQDNAQQALARGNLDEAASEVQQAAADDPANLRIKHLAAQIFTARGTADYKGDQMLAAEDDFRRAVDYEPTYAAAYDYVGLIAFSKHDWQGAINYGD